MLDRERRKIFDSIFEMHVSQSRVFVFQTPKNYRNFRDAFDRYKKKSNKKFTFKFVKNNQYLLFRYE